MSRPSIEELNQVAEFKKSFGFTPNLVTDVYKNRRGRWNMVRIWSMHDLGTCRKYDLFITTANLKSVDNFIIVDFTAYEDETLKDLELLYNTGEISDTLNNQLYVEPNSENILDNLTNAFGDDNDRLERPVIEAIEAGKEIDKILVKKDLNGDLVPELLGLVKQYGCLS